MKTIFKFSVELEELVGRKWQMAPNRMFQQLTDKTKKKHRPFYEAVDAHARRRLKKHRPFYEAVDAYARRRLIGEMLVNFAFREILVILRLLLVCLKHTPVLGPLRRF